MKCPFCQEENKESNVYPGYGGSTLLGHTPYYDKDGMYHNHDPNTHTREYKCSNGHRWEERGKHQCSSCDYGKDTLIIKKL